MSRRCNKSLHQPHMLHIQPIEENINGQWNRVQEQALDGDIREAENRTKVHTHLFTTVQWQNRRIPQISQSNNRETIGNQS